MKIIKFHKYSGSKFTLGKISTEHTVTGNDSCTILSQGISYKISSQGLKFVSNLLHFQLFPGKRPQSLLGELRSELQEAEKAFDLKKLELESRKEDDDDDDNGESGS